MKEEYNCRLCKERLYTKRVPIFDSLSKEELDKVIEIRKHVHLRKSENLFLEGDEVSKLFIISDGIIKITKVTSSGKEQIINILSIGDFFGETNVIGVAKKSNISATAIKDSEICTISKDDLESLISENPKIALKLLDGLNKKLVEYQNLTTNLSNNSPDSTIASMLLEFIEKYSFYRDDKLVIKLPLNREELANYCGIARETLSRKLTVLEKEGIIELKSKEVIVLNKSAIENIIL